MAKTTENGKTVKGTQVTLQKLPDPEPRGKRFPCLYYWLTGLTASGVVLVVTVCTALVYKHRLETLQSRVNALEEYCFDIETTMRNYVDERLRNILFQQVSKTFSIPDSLLFIRTAWHPRLLPVCKKVQGVQISVSKQDTVC